MDPTVPRRRTPEELSKAFEQQLAALSASCANYDLGNDWEALRLATTTHILVFDGGRQRSLLSQLRIKGSLAYVSSNRVGSWRDNAPPHFRNMTMLMEETPLILIALSSGQMPKYVPILDMPLKVKSTSFRAWWEEELIFKDGDYTLSRMQLVSSLRNQDGGSHFDPQLGDPNYVEFAHNDKWEGFVGESPKKRMDGRHLAAMRQIAFELLETLKAYRSPG